MRNMIQAVVTVGVMLLCGGSSGAQAPGGLGTEEFGLTTRQLVQSVEKVEALIAKCMRAQGFQYIAADYITVRRGMAADKNMPGDSEEEERALIERFVVPTILSNSGDEDQPAA